MRSPIWQERYRPTTLDAFDFDQWRAFPISNHILIYGPPGAGKKTRVRALLRDLYGDEGERKVVNAGIKEMKNTPLIYTETQTYLEIDFTGYGNKDRIIVQEFLRGLTEIPRLTGPRIIVLAGADHIAPLTQKMLLSIIEKTRDRFIFIVRALSKIIEPLRSRCILKRQRAPSLEELRAILGGILKAEGLKGGTKKRLDQFAESRNLGRAIHHLQMSYSTGSKFKMYKDKGESYLAKLIREIEKRDIMAIRRTIYTLVSKNVENQRIFLYLGRYFATRSSRPDLIWHGCARYELALASGNKVPYYIDAFIAYCVNVEDGIIWTSMKPLASLLAPA